MASFLLLFNSLQVPLFHSFVPQFHRKPHVSQKVTQFCFSCKNSHAVPMHITSQSVSSFCVVVSPVRKLMSSRTPFLYCLHLPLRRAHSQEGFCHF